VNAAQKSEQFRTQGLDTKFKRGEDIEAFADKLLEFAQDKGLDTITYVPDPLDPSTSMISCLSQWGRLSLEFIRANIGAQETKYDKYDWSNDKDLTKYLLNSLDSHLHKSLKTRIHDGKDTTFVHHFMHLIQILHPTSVDGIDKIKEDIKRIKPNQFSGEDVTKMTEKYRELAMELVTAGQYEHILTYKMVESLLEASSSQRSTYHRELEVIYDKLRKHLVTLGHMTRLDANTLIANENLTYQDVCELADQQYAILKSDGNWPAARSNPDSKRPPAAMYQGNAITMDQVNVLIQNALGGKRDKSNDKCNNCGELGHWSQDCRKKSQGRHPNSRNGKGRGIQRTNKHQKGRGHGTGRFSAADKFQAPKPGEPYSKTLGGRKVEWCSKCDPPRWSTTHNTSTHTGKPSSSGPSNTGQANFVMHSAWNATLNPVVPQQSCWSLLLQMLRCLVVAPLIWGTVSFLGVIDLPWSAIYTVVAPHFGLIVLLLNFVALFFGIQYLDSRLGADASEPEPDGYLPRWKRRQGKHFVKKRRRGFNRHYNVPKPIPRYTTRNVLIPNAAPRRRFTPTQHRDNALHGIHAAAKTRAFENVSEALQRLVQFERAITFERTFMRPPSVEEGEEAQKAHHAFVQWHLVQKEEEEIA